MQPPHGRHERLGVEASQLAGERAEGQEVREAGQRRLPSAGRQLRNAGGRRSLAPDDGGRRSCDIDEARGDRFQLGVVAGQRRA
jgi:hypothetical protein